MSVKPIKKILVLLTAMTILTGCSAPVAGTSGGDKAVYEGFWIDEYGDVIRFLPEENAYVFKKPDGRVGRGTYDTRNAQISYDRFIYDLISDGEDSFTLNQNGSTTNEGTEVIDAYVFAKTDEVEITEYDSSLLDGVWVSDRGVTLEIDMDIKEYNIEYEQGSGVGTIYDYSDGKGVYLFTDDFSYVIWYDQDTISFETSDPVCADSIFTREADQYGEDY